jgi:hypothetical protein
MIAAVPAAIVFFITLGSLGWGFMIGLLALLVTYWHGSPRYYIYDVFGIVVGFLLALVIRLLAAKDL